MKREHTDGMVRDAERNAGRAKRPRTCGCGHEQTRHALVDVGEGVQKHVGRRNDGVIASPHLFDAKTKKASA